MSTFPVYNRPVYWPRVKQILDTIMERWKVGAGRAPYPGIHDYYWETPQKLQQAVLSGHRAIEPGVAGKDTNLVLSLARGVKSTGRMPLHGPFLSPEELNEIIVWIDTGMPEMPPVYWPRVKEILDTIMERWKVRAGRQPYPGIHEYYWETPQQLQKAVLSGHRAIEPGVAGKDTNLVRSLARGVRGTGRMPLRGPFLSTEELNEIIVWIDTGMPEKPPVYWPRVKEILDTIMDRWKVRAGRQPYPGIHEYYWETAEKLQQSVLSGHRAIEPGVPGKDTNLVRSLARGVRGTGRMPLRGPFLSQEELDEIISWIDTGMPEGPQATTFSQPPDE